MALLNFWRRKPAAPAARPWDTPGRLGVAAAMLSDRGLVRAGNEDAVVYCTGAASEGDAFDLIAILADGMGGHAAGEVASEIAVATVRKALQETRAEPSLALAAAFRDANRAIRDHAQQHPETRGMGATCTAIFVRGDRLWLGHVGDSRAYLLRQGVLELLSQDHTVRAQLLRDGAISEDDMGAAAGLLLRALGAADEVEPMLSAGRPLGDGDQVLLCSDGLHGVVADTDIVAALNIEAPALASAALVQAALAAGGPDNVSVGVFRFSAPVEVADASGAPTRPQGLPAAANG